MKKRAGLARAMALDPEILFFDEPSAGLDPLSSRRLDDLILDLRDSLGDDHRAGDPRAAEHLRARRRCRLSRRGARDHDRPGQAGGPQGELRPQGTGFPESGTRMRTRYTPGRSEPSCSAVWLSSWPRSCSSAPSRGSCSRPLLRRVSRLGQGPHCRSPGHLSRCEGRSGSQRQGLPDRTSRRTHRHRGDVSRSSGTWWKPRWVSRPPSRSFWAARWPTARAPGCPRADVEPEPPHWPEVHRPRFPARRAGALRPSASRVPGAAHDPHGHGEAGGPGRSVPREARRSAPGPHARRRPAGDPGAPGDHRVPRREGSRRRRAPVGRCAGAIPRRGA